LKRVREIVDGILEPVQLDQTQDIVPQEKPQPRHEETKVIEPENTEKKGNVLDSIRNKLSKKPVEDATVEKSSAALERTRDQLNKKMKLFLRLKYLLQK